MFQMFEYLRVVRTVTSKFRFFTLENGHKFQGRFEDTRFQASAPLLPTQNLLSLASTFLWEPMRFAFGIPIFKKVLSLSASEGFRREIASGIPKKLRNLSCFQPNSSEVALWRPRVASQIEKRENARLNF